MGATLKEEDFKREWEEAKPDANKRANFLRLRLNIVTRADVTFIDLPLWDACCGLPASVAGDAWYGDSTSPR